MNVLKKWWVKLLLLIAAIVLVLAIVLATSSGHSKSAVDRYRDQLRAAGEKMDFKDVIPPHPDPGSNGLEFFTQAFAAMAPTANGILSTNAPSAMKMVAPGKAMIGWQQSEIVSFYQNDAVTNTWADLDQQLQLGSAAIDFLRQGTERPQLDFELDYDQGASLLLPHLAKIKQASLLLTATTLADMHRGDSASAATNLHTLLITINIYKDEPLLISQLVRIAMAQIAVTAQWEFLQGTNLTDQQLGLLQRDWTRMQFVQPMEQSLLMERVWGARTIEQLRTSNSPSSYYSGMLSGSSGGGGSGDWLDMLKDVGTSVKQKTSDTLWRVSWSYDDELKLMQGDQVLIEAMRDVRTNGFFKNALADADHKISTMGLDRVGTNWLRNHIGDELEGLFGSGTVLSLRRSLERVLNCEAARIMTFTAIALKRYELRHGTFPPDLNALVPEFLSEVPRDPVDGHPLRYRANGDGTFLLYSIGSDGIDNAGDTTGTGGAKSINWLRGRDWVWPLPATQRELEFFRANPPK
jgi:hypothetical protein